MKIKEKLEKTKVLFSAIVEEAFDVEDKREDFLVKNVANNMWMSSDGKLCFTSNGQLLDYSASSWALSQLSTKIGMPSKYAEQCINAGHADLAADNVNTWLTEQNGNKRKKTTDYFVRTYDGKIDGVLSSSYTRFDTTKILDVLEKTIATDEYDIVGSFVSNERMHLRMIQDEMIDVDGEDLFPCLFIDSSDVGRCALNISFGIWKKVCTNGLCIPKINGVLYHQRHVGITPLAVETEMVNNLKMIPTFITKSKEIIKKAAAEKINLTNAAEFNKVMTDIRRLTKTSEDEAKKIIAIAKEKYAESRWGIVNSLTEYAQNFELDQRLQIERAAGLYIAA